MQAMTKNAVTVERLERALALCAFLLVRDGPVIALLFERLERELKLMQYLFLIHTAIVDLVNRLDAEEVRRVAGI